MHITEISKNIPEEIVPYLRVASNPAIQEELDKLEEIAIKRQIMNERIEDFGEEKEEREFLKEIKDQITGPVDEKVIKEIGSERLLAKYRKERKVKTIG